MSETTPEPSFLSTLAEKLEFIDFITLRDRETIKGIAINDYILLEFDPRQARHEGIVVNVTEESVQIALKNGNRNWFPHNIITDNLGQASQIQQSLFGISKEPILQVTDATTGTYIYESENGPFLVEVDRVGKKYIIHGVGESTAATLTQSNWEHLQQFSDPDNGDYLIEPGLYFVQVIQQIVEVIPYNNRCYYRYADSAQLFCLTPAKVADMIRIESDNLDVNAVLIVDKSELQAGEPSQGDESCNSENEPPNECSSECSGNCSSEQSVPDEIPCS